MERWERPVIRHHYKENPSFSSTLLDAIYRSIDDPESKRQEESMICRETMRKKHGNSFKGGENNIKEKELQRACIIEKWMEKKNSYENVDIRRKSVAGIDKKPQRKEFDSVLLNSSSTSSESSCGGGFSSSESDSIYGTSRSSSSYTMRRPKPIKTSISQPSETERCNQYQNRNVYATTQKPKGNSFVKTKSKALKIYGDLKKVKQPISPGGRLSSFLNSIFTTANQKKAKLSASSAGFDDRKLMNKSATEPVSTCSSASSLSRSCLSKTPSSSGKLSAKRSVRFDPLSVIVDEDSRPCGHKNLYEENIMAISTKRTNSTNEELKYRVMTENRRVEEVARDLLNNYQKKEVNMNTRDVILCSDSDEEEEEEDDTASCASSDLFELDNLSVIGIERYREELPVYETTHLSTNRAIADGLIVIVS